MQIISVVFAAVTLFLFFIRYTAHPSQRVYFYIPIGILALVYCIVYTAILGWPFANSLEITENDIDQEVIKIYRKFSSSDLSNMTEDEHLELKQIEEILLDQDDSEDYV